MSVMNELEWLRGKMFSLFKYAVRICLASAVQRQSDTTPVGRVL